MSALQAWVEHAATAIKLPAVAIILVTIAYSTAVYLGRLTRGAAIITVPCFPERLAS